MESHEAIVLSRRKVVVNSDNIIVTGIGGIIGSQFGGGKGQIATALAGAGLGAVAGNKIGKDTSKQQAWEYSVKVKNSGRIFSVVQGLDVNVNVGSNVLLHTSRGKSSIVPLSDN